MTAGLRRESRRALSIFAAFAVLAGCAGAEVTLTAKTAAYPISLSSSVGDATRKVWDRTSLEWVGTFSAHRTRLGFLYADATPRDAFDLSDDVNAQVRAAGGEAIVELAVTISGSCDGLNGFPILNILPFWPGCLPIQVSGTIVRRRK